MYMRLERDLINSKLAVGSNPDPWMIFIERLVSELNECTVTGKSEKIDTSVILHILCHLPESCEGVAQELGTKLEENPTACTLQLVREGIMLRYKRE